MDYKNKEIMNYIENLLKNKGFKTEYKSKCLIMSIKNKYTLLYLLSSLNLLFRYF